MSAPWVVVRSRNDIAFIRGTLEAVRRQTMPCRLLNIDNGSTDGTLDVVRAFTDELVQIPAGDYVPGRVLNKAMEMTDGEVVVFLNSDATPQGANWLENLLRAIDGDDVAAAYGRQIARPDARPLFAHETDRAFGDGVEAQRWVHFFSMASSAIRRRAWRARPFSEAIQFSEDIEWSYWARKAGYKIAYAPDSVAMHSHNYTLRQSYRRHFGEGAADATIFSLPRSRETFAYMVGVSALAAIARDLTFCLGAGRCPASLFHSLALRPTQRWAHYRGYWSAKKAGAP
ncbi:MAG TPA: glycosyltransferase [Candidatus Hydrogenedentes bacterium]|nr:glycosyltransferase [Candidatus Hydrogenedentota bacterium]HOS01499.1 glycosyltransferase [Candidatus Hydrogenedentota bacterium]